LSKFSDAVQKWMQSVDALEVNIEGHKVLVLQRKNNLDHQAHLIMWLEGNISTEDFMRYMRDYRKYWWVEYPLDIFKEEVFNT